MAFPLLSRTFLSLIFLPYAQNPVQAVITLGETDAEHIKLHQHVPVVSVVLRAYPPPGPLVSYAEGLAAQDHETRILLHYAKFIEVCLSING